MGGLYKLTFRGADQILGTSDDKPFDIYLETGAFQYYKDNTDNQLELIRSIDDTVIVIFQLQNATTDGISATREQLRNYARQVLNMTDAEAEAFVNRHSGITRDQMIVLNDVFQADIIEQRAKEIEDFNKKTQETINVQEASTTPSEAKEIAETFEEAFASIFDQPDPLAGVSDPSQLPHTITDIAKEEFLQIDETLTDPLTGDKTKEIDKTEVEKPVEGSEADLEFESQTTPSPEVSDPDFLNRNKDALIVGGILSAITLTAIVLLNRMKVK